MRPLLRVAWYRFQATFTRRRGSYLGVVLLTALIGGLAMGAAAGARRTESSFPTYFASGSFLASSADSNVAAAQQW
jgi:hypothetical protein